jgi:hypothetical protein
VRNGTCGEDPYSPVLLAKPIQGTEPPHLRSLTSDLATGSG